MRDALPVRLHVQHDDALLDRHRRRLPPVRNHPDEPVREDVVDGAKVGQRRGLRRGLEVRVGVDDRAPAARFFDVLDAYRNFPPDDLVSV